MYICVCVSVQVCTYVCDGPGEVTLDSVVLCPCGVGTSVPESLAAGVTTWPSSYLHTLCSAPWLLCPCRGRPNYPVPISLIHWNLLLHSPCIPIHWCQNNNNNNKKTVKKTKTKAKTTTPHSTDFNIISPWNIFFKTKVICKIILFSTLFI